MQMAAAQDFTLHTHTVGFDGRNTPAQMVARACEMGFRTIGISNHFIVYPGISRARMYWYARRGGYDGIYSESFDATIEKFRAHYAELDALAGKYDIRILRGIEVDFFTYPTWRDGFERAVRILRPDYTIGSAHFVVHDGRLCNTHDAANAAPADQTAILNKYWENVAMAASSGLFTWMAHLDLFKKTGLGTGDQWAPAENRALDAIRDAGIGLEVNTSPYSAHYSEPYPGARIMRGVAARNIPVLVSDDAHAANQIGRDFERAEQFIAQMGVKNRLGIQKILDFRSKTL